MQATYLHKIELFYGRDLFNNVEASVFIQASQKCPKITKILVGLPHQGIHYSLEKFYDTDP